MNIIYLAGGGNAIQSKDTDIDFLKEIDKNKKILYIPVAMPLEKRSYDDCYQWITEVFNNLNFFNIELISDLSEIKSKNMNKYSSIYIGGGNTYLLLKIIQENNIFPFLKKYLRNNGIIYGGSAGAIIFGETIETSSDKNTENLSDLNGLGILKKYNISCHYKEEKEEKLRVLLKNLQYNKIIAIPETSSLKIDLKNKFAKVIGNKVYVIEKGKKTIIIKKNSILDLNEILTI